MNKKGNVLIYTIFVFIAVLLFSLLSTIIIGVSDDIRNEVSKSSSTDFIATRTANETLSPIGNGITSTAVTRNNDTWLNFNGTTDYLFIPDNNYVSVAFWVNDSDNNWLFVVNSSDLVYEDNVVVGALTLNPFKKNATGWYFGINDSGFFGGNIDSIKFYNDTMNETQILTLYADGR